MRKNEDTMSVPSEKLMEMIKGQRGAPSAAPAPAAPDTSAQSDAETPPMSAPMSTPEPKMGSREGAMINISMAMDLIEQALPALGSESPEGAKALAVLRQMSGILGGKKEKTKELQNAEIMQMLQNLPQAGGATPEGKAMAAAPAIPGMAPAGGGGMPMLPGGMSPGGAPQPQ
jgi:hypothetical protein